MVMGIATIATASAVATAATAALTAQAVDETLDFVLGCLAALNNLTREAQGLARKWVIEVHLHFVIGDFENTAVESVAILILQWHDGIHKYILVVEMSIYLKYATVKVKNPCRLIVAVSLLFCELEVKLRPWFEIDDLLFKFVKRHPESSDELEWLCRWCFLYFLSFFAFNGVKRIAYSHEHVVLSFHY